MHRAEASLERGDAIAGRLDHELTLGVALDLSFPPVRRHHRAVDVDARGEPLVDERTRQLVRTRIVGHRGQHDHKIRHLLSLAGPNIFLSRRGPHPPPRCSAHLRLPTAQGSRSPAPPPPLSNPRRGPPPPPPARAVRAREPHAPCPRVSRTRRPSNFLRGV